MENEMNALVEIDKTLAKISVKGDAVMLLAQARAMLNALYLTMQTSGRGGTDDAVAGNDKS